MKLPPLIPVALCAVTLLCSPGTSRGANLITTNVQASGQNWTAAIWKTDIAGTTVVAPVAGNTYEAIFNGTFIGNGAGSTRLRNPASAGLQTFPGDSLTLGTNAELRAKAAGAILNFPGTNGSPGLILNGGMLNGGDDTTFVITGRIQVASQSFISHGANGGGGGISANRAFNIAGALSGTGAMVIMNSGTTVAQQISGNTNSFSGQWIVQCGWLLGSGTNSLGTNSITVDPLYTDYINVMPTAASPAGPARFEVNYDINSAGTLTLVNGGIMRLHQNCVFSAVIIEGQSLSRGTHYYSELITNFPASFATGGSGSITVQPYGPPPALGPMVDVQPLPQMLYAGRTAHFSVVASGPGSLGYRWRKNGTFLTDGGNIAGANSTALTVSAVAAADAATYDVVVTNASGSATSTGVTLSLVTPSGEAYETAVLAANPAVYYRLNETGDPASSTVLAYDYAGGFNGTYGAGLQNGNALYNIAGPASAVFPGFGSNNKAARFANGTGTARLTVQPWNLNTNTVTLAAWINPGAYQANAAAVVFCRGGGTVAGLNYYADPLSGLTTLGYTWNNEWETYTWNSGLVPPPDQWSLAALVITPTNATVHVMNATGLVSSSRAYNHVPQSFAGTTLIGDDSNDNGNGSRVFSGIIDDVAVFGSALSPSQLMELYSAASGQTQFAPAIGAQPVSFQSLYAGQTAQFTVGAGGSPTLQYQWQKNSGAGYVNVTDGGRIAGATSPTLVISGLVAGDAAEYAVRITNPHGTVTSSASSLFVIPTLGAEAITLAVQQASGRDWNNTDWSDGMGATDSAAMKPGSTYEVLPPGRLRSPQNPRTAVFPGNVLTLSGDGVWVNSPPDSNTTTISELRLKQPNPGTILFKKLVMKGGQIDTGNDGVAVIAGQIDIQTNAPFYNDGGNDRGYQIDAWLTGAGSIEYRGYNQGSFMPNYTNNLNITGTSNTFKGKWNVVIGTLLGTGLNSLGANDITVGPNGALETTYDINNPNNALFLNGRMFLHQNHTFKGLIISGTPISPGTYSFAQLNASYPTNFPASWTPQNGAASFSTGSGSITVLGTVPPTITANLASQTFYVGETARLAVAVTGGQPMAYQWRAGSAGVYTNLTDGGQFAGATTSDLTIANLVAANSADYVVVVTNAGGAVTSAVATVTVLPVGSPMTITMAPQQSIGQNWETAASWSDNRPASRSAVGNPGSTYEILPGARMRSPENVTNAVFPGAVVKVDGNGTWMNNPAGTDPIGELRFKQPLPAASIYFAKLIMNGGQLDLGNDGVAVVQGQMDIAANSAFNNNSTADRGYRIEAWLTGTGAIEYHGYQTNFIPGYVNSLNIAGTSNTFSGNWNVVAGILLGTAPNALGRGDITVGADGALETTYDINNPGGTLVLNGQMFLHQNDKFRSVTIGGVALAPGTYSFAQLAASYPANFPATWTAHTGAEAFSTGAGSLTVYGDTPPPVNVQFGVANNRLSLTWSQGILLEADNLTGPWTTNTTATSPFTINPLTAAKKFYRVQVR